MRVVTTITRRKPRYSSPSNANYWTRIYGVASLVFDLAARQSKLVQQIAEERKVSTQEIIFDLKALKQDVDDKIDRKYGSRGAPSKFTASTRQRILSLVRRGAFPHVAATATGINKQTWKHWKADERPHFKAFFDQVDSSAHEARLTKEHEIFNDEPTFWLKHAAKTVSPDEPGWSDSTHITQDINVAGQLTNTHTIDIVPVLNTLPLETRRLILDRIDEYTKTLEAKTTATPLLTQPKLIGRST